MEDDISESSSVMGTYKAGAGIEAFCKQLWLGCHVTRSLTKSAESLCSELRFVVDTPSGAFYTSIVDTEYVWKYDLACGRIPG
jgi:hypothetical protein